MAHKTTTFKFRGTFDFHKLYDTAYKWLKGEQFLVFEDTYKHKPPGEVEMKFHGDKKVTGFIMYRISIRFFSQEFKIIEAVKDGKKKEMVQGRILIETSFDVITDYEGLWSTSPFKERMKNFLVKHIMQHKIDAVHVDPLYYKVLGLNEKLKAVLGMDTYKGTSHKRPASYDEEGGYGE